MKKSFLQKALTTVIQKAKSMCDTMSPPPLPECHVLTVEGYIKMVLKFVPSEIGILFRVPEWERHWNTSDTKSHGVGRNHWVAFQVGSEAP